MSDQLGAGIDFFDGISDQGFDFLSGGCRALGQVADLAGDHGKTTPSRALES